ncbi:MAG TPA: DUF177 domain-containing protein [Acidimicrobiales bacterium]
MNRSPLLVNVAPLRRRVGSRRREQRTARLAGLAVIGSRVREGEEVAVDVLLESVHHGILASGTVSAGWEAECRRCLGPARGQLTVAVRELYEETPRADAGDDDTYPLTGDQLDLAPLARDAVLLELPLAPLCTEACLGLCPTCGANRNEQRCSCEAPRDERWAALEVLRGGGPGRPAE